MSCYLLNCFVRFNYELYCHVIYQTASFALIMNSIVMLFTKLQGLNFFSSAELTERIAWKVRWIFNFSWQCIDNINPDICWSCWYFWPLNFQRNLFSEIDTSYFTLNITETGKNILQIQASQYQEWLQIHCTKNEVFH